MKPGCLNPLNWMRLRVPLPWKGRSVQLGWTLLFLILAGTILALSISHTSQSVFCASCHEMDEHFATWQVSSHKSVPCESCHVSPGLLGMFRTKIGATRMVAKHVAGHGTADGIQGHVPDANCKKCHKTTREWIVYHGLKISHQKHWDRNISCIFCHKKVVHGPNAATINVPTMEMCYECHDGKKAPNRCGLCHETLGVRKPSTFSREWREGHVAEVAGKPEACMRCHQQTFCSNCHNLANPHDAGFIDSHAQAYKRNPKSCDYCHTQGLKSPTCASCHSQKRAHPVAYVNTHPAEVKKAGDASCQKCHNKQFCTDCHTRYQPHPPGWIEAHPRSARENLARCQTCHTLKYCEACHTSQQPASHKQPDWLRSHKKAVVASAGQCQTCHTQKFCQACHQKKPPASHKADWTRKHGRASMAGQEQCQACHIRQTCANCHGMPMPHPAGFRKAHAGAARANRKLCDRCHTRQYCSDCHTGSRPASHNTPGWASAAHGKPASKNQANCLACHKQQYCQSCHSMARPASHRAKDFISTHGTADRAKCTTCHKSGKFCQDCHSTKRPPSHDATWVATHGKAASAGKSNCAYCHNRTLCGKCHSSGGVKPSSHNETYIMGHAKPAKANLRACGMCHTAELCNGCHKAMNKPEIRL